MSHLLSRLSLPVHTSSNLALHLRTEGELKQTITYDLLETGIREFDAIAGGIPRGAITDVYGTVSSGKTAFLHAFLARATRAGEFCALVDATDAFDPETAAHAEADLKRLLWVRCRNSVEALKAADLLVHSGGWGVVVLDLGDVPPAMLRKLPISYWYRFRRAVENTPSAFLVFEREPFVRNCAAMTLEISQSKAKWTGKTCDFQLFGGMDVNVVPRKSAQSETRASFHARALA